MYINQIVSSCLSTAFKSLGKDKSSSMKEAMLSLETKQIVQLLNQGVDPTIATPASDIFKEKLSHLLIGRFFNKTCCLVFLNGLENHQLSNIQQMFKEEVFKHPNYYSESVCQAVCLQIIQDNLSKEMLPLNVVNIALLTQDSALTEKLIEMKILDPSLSPHHNPHTYMCFNLFSPKPNMELFEKLIESGYPMSEICNGENQSDLEQALELYSDFLPTKHLVYKIFQPSH